MVAYCTKAGHGARLMPPGTITGAHFVSTANYIQLTGRANLQNIDINGYKDGGGELPSDSTLAKAIQRDFGGYDKFKEKLTAAALGIQGSGWAWLSYDKATGRLRIETTANQDPLTATVPILGAFVTN